MGCLEINRKTGRFLRWGDILGWVVLVICLGVMVLGILFFQGARILEDRIRHAENPGGRFETIEISRNRSPRQLVLPYSAPPEADFAYSRIGRMAVVANVISGLLSRTHGG